MSSTDTQTQYEQCPTLKTLEQIGSKWRLIVFWGLQDGELRFNELKRKTGASSQTLSRVLDNLQELGFVERRVEADGPVAVYYALTQKGAELESLFEDVEQWAERWIEAEESTSLVGLLGTTVPPCDVTTEYRCSRMNTFNCCSLHYQSSLDLLPFAALVRK